MTKPTVKPRRVTTARTDPKPTIVRFGPDEAPLHRIVCNASMPNAQPGYRWPHLTTPARFV